MSILDYLYIDLPKLASLQSQMTGKPVASPAGVDLAGFEMDLAAQGQLLDLTRDTRPLRDPGLRQLLGGKLCVKVKGRAVLEDYPRLRQMLDVHAQTAAFANQSVLDGLRSSDDYKQLEMTVAALSDQLKEEVDRNARTESQNRLRQMKDDMDETVSGAGVAQPLEPAVLDGLKAWINSYLADTIVLRVYPLGAAPDEQVMGPLVREHFAGGNASALQFAHGRRPTQALTLLGIVTAVPTAATDDFDPLAEFEGEDIGNARMLEKMHRQAAGHAAALAELSRGCRFPRLMVQPLLVYKSFSPG